MRKSKVSHFTSIELIIERFHAKTFVFMPQRNEMKNGYHKYVHLAPTPRKKFSSSPCSSSIGLLGVTQHSVANAKRSEKLVSINTVSKYTSNIRILYTRKQDNNETKDNRSYTFIVCQYCYEEG